jgi:hypothetical protein
MELTWIAILASLCMAIAAVCVFIFAVKKDYFHNLEDTKYQVFWSDLEDIVDAPVVTPVVTPKEKRNHACGQPESH